MVAKRVIARERSDRSNLAQITGLLRLQLAMTVSDFSIIVKNIAIFQQSLLIINCFCNYRANIHHQQLLIQPRGFDCIGEC